MKFEKSDIKRLFMVLAGAALMAVNLKMFAKVGGIYPGGATGLTMLIQTISETYLGFDISFTFLNIVINAIPAYIGFKHIGKKFTLFSILMILVSGLLVDMIPRLQVTHDPLLVSVFGGIMNAVAIAICLHGDTSSGGTDFIAIYLSRKKGKDAFPVVLGVNVVILATAGFLFGWDKALYSIIFQYVSTQALRILYRKYQQVTFFIVTNRSKEVCSRIYDLTTHGATIMNAEGSFEGDGRKMVYSVVDAADRRNVIDAIHEIDPCAFINSVNTAEIRGNFHLNEID